MEAIILADVLHTQLFHFASQRIAAPAQKFGRVLLQTVSLAQRHPDQYALDLGHRLIQQPARARVEFLLSPMRKLRHPIMICGLAGRYPAEIGRDVLGAYLPSGRGDSQASAGVDELADIARPIES